MTPLRYSELTPEMIAVLRIEASLEGCYPQNGARASQILAGWSAWKAKHP